MNEIKKISGKDKIEGLDNLGLDRYFNPNDYDRKMSEIYGDDFYNDQNYDP